MPEDLSRIRSPIARGPRRRRVSALLDSLHHRPPASREGVRTATPPSLVGSPCPVCKERPLKGRQTVCSGSRRAKRWRARSVDQRRAPASREEETRALLETALKKLGERP